MPININTNLRNALLDGVLNTHAGQVFDGGTAIIELYDGAQPTSDGTIKDADVDVADPVPAWAASTAYAANKTVQPTGANGYYYVSSGGTSGGAEPTWPTVVGNTVVDNDITWTCIGAVPTLLASLAMPAVAFNAAAGGSAAMSAQAQDPNADAGGTATWARVRDAAGTHRVDGDVTGTGGGGFVELDNTVITAGGQVTVTALSLTMPAA